MEFWETLSIFQRTVIIMTVPFVILLGVQFMLSLFGTANFMEYSDVDPNSGESDKNLDRGLRGPKGLLGLARIICAFFGVGGLVALSVSLSNVSDLNSGLIGAGAGALSAGLLVLFIRLSEKIPVIGKLDPEKAVGFVGEVTIPIPPKNYAQGQIKLVINGKTYDVDAGWEGDFFISSGDKVLVTEARENYVIVEPQLGL